MGNSKSSTATSNAAVNTHAVVRITTTDRTGARGLLDLGFEYRFIPCEKHHDEETSKPPNYGPDKICFDCTTRLFHIESDTVVTAKNQKELIGYMFDEVCRVSQELAQEWMQRDCGFRVVELFDNHKDNVSPIRAMVSPDYSTNNDDQQQQQPTLLIITGKGKSRMGIISVQHHLVSGFEKGSALYYTTRAIQKKWAVVLLDPNAWGVHRGMEVVQHSLNELALRGPLYILAHSAAGGYLVRYMLDHLSLVNQIRALVFTDSTHRIQWARNRETLMEFLQSPKCLYVRNNSERPSDTFANHKNKPAGESCDGDDDVFWCQRFGTIQTVWAGTTDHSYVCHAARRVIWDFFEEHG